MKLNLDRPAGQRGDGFSFLDQFIELIFVVSVRIDGCKHRVAGGNVRADRDCIR